VSVYIPVFVLGYISYNQYGVQLEKAAEAVLSNNLHNNVERLNVWFDEIERRSVDIYSSLALQQLLQATKDGTIAQSEFLYELAKIRQAFAGKYELNIFPADMVTYPSYSVLRNNLPKLKEGWYERALEANGRGFWLFEKTEEYGNRYADFYFIRPIRSLTPGFDNLGVMVIRVPDKTVKERMVANQEYTSFKLMIIDDQGRNVMEPDSRFSYSFFAGTVPPDNRFRLMEDRSGKAGYFTASIPIKVNGWRMAAIIPVSDVLGPIQRIQAYTWLALSISLAVITLLLAMITRSVTVPIKTLVRFMKKVQLGVLDRCRPHADRRDEIGQLVGGYNVMINGMSELLEATKQSEREKRNLELQMLMHQINPHFLYNTLDSIKWKANAAQAAEIADMATSLADLLRFSLNDGKEMTTLEREMEHVKSYVNIEHMRKGDFQVLYHIHPSILNVPFMKLIVQPIVENAIRHGIERQQAGAGKLLISVYRDGQDVVCRIEDNGPGCQSEEMDLLRRLVGSDGEEPIMKRGFGMTNVHRRLRIRFGPPYGLQIDSNRTDGLCVIIRHPYLHNSPM
jgi:sensor histidine kinase YesM